MQNISENLKLNRFTVNKRAEEWKELGVELKEYFGQPMWHFFKLYDWHTFHYALKECKKKDIRNVGYFRAILNNQIKK